MGMLAITHRPEIGKLLIVPIKAKVYEMHFNFGSVRNGIYSSLLSDGNARKMREANEIYLD